MEAIFNQLDAELRSRFFAQPDKTAIQILETILQEIGLGSKKQQVTIKKIMGHFEQVIGFIEEREHILARLGQ